MKKIIIIIGIIIVVAAAIQLTKPQATVEAPVSSETQQASFQTLSEGRYEVNQDASTLAWEGTGPLTKRHYGTVNINSGFITLTDTNMSGEVIFDMNTISSEQGDDSMLDRDLKSENFFEVATYPTSTFTIDAYQDGQITGDLTIRDTTERISLPVVLNSTEGQLTLVGETVINRLDWGIEFRSGTIFADIGDRLVSDTIPIRVELVLELVEENE